MPDPPPLRVALVAPPFIAVPPLRYGGTERVVAELAAALLGRGHQVTVFASGDSTTPAELVPTEPVALWDTGSDEDRDVVLARTVEVVAAAAIPGRFDVVHAHLDQAGLALAARLPAGPPGPRLVHTIHQPMDGSDPRFRPGRGRLVALSEAQRAAAPSLDWIAVVPNGLDLAAMPFGRVPGDDLCFVGRIDRQKGPLEAIEIAGSSGRRLRVAARIGDLASQQSYAESVFLPAARRADVEFLGELAPADRDRLLATSYATLMPVRWPEPFGLVAVESLACGTPVLAHALGALPEIVRHGRDGFLGRDPAELAGFVDAVAGLDRAAVRAGALDRFGRDRMAVRYEAVYRRLLAEGDGRVSPER
ncbi:MAG TPA: glycosyltransferase family 4 protein [Candidatus Limnocylindrales bacterium]